MSKCDTREPKTITTPLVRAGWQLQALPYGDYELVDSVNEPILIERKTVVQLLADLATGQLHRQARALTEATNFPILLIEGHWQQSGGKLLNSRFTWQQVWNALASLQDLGCRLQITTGLEHTIQRLFELEEYYAKEFHASISRSPSGDSYLSCLGLVHGISTSKAKAIKEQYPVLVDVVSANEEELALVSGIGSKLARRLYEFWR